MATCDASQILANAIAAGYDRLSKRDLVAVCVSSLPASTLEASVASLKDSELSEYDTAECVVQALCSSPGSSNSADQILAAAQANKIDQLSRRDLDAVQVSLLCTKTNPPCSAPTAPINPTAKVITGSTILIIWNQIANTGSLITGYTVKWGTVTGVYTNSANVPAIPKSYTITGLTSGTQYFFVVQATTAIGGCVSANSNEGNATTSGSAPSPCGTVVNDWVARIIANGGAAPSAATQTAVCTFWASVITAGIDTLMKEVNIFAPDSVTAALTPLIVTREANLWTAATATISNNGLVCNATTVVNTAGSGPNYFTANTAGMTWYGAAPGSRPDGIQCGTGTGGNDCIFLYPGGGVCYAYPSATAVTGGTPFALNSYGMMSLNRIASNDLRVFWGSQAVPVVQAGFTANAPGAVPVAPSWNVGNQAGLGGRFLYNFSQAYTHAFFAVHLGLTLAQATALQAAVQTLRLAFGGSA